MNFPKFCVFLIYSVVFLGRTVQQIPAKIEVIKPVQAAVVEVAPQRTTEAGIGLVEPKPNLLPIPALNGWDGYTLLRRIASCESWGDPNKLPRQFKDGLVLQGDVNPNDIGLAQINIPTWGEQAKKIGYDLYSYEGNLAMAKWIFDRYGSAPWIYSAKCWQ